MKIKFVDQNGIIRNVLEADISIERIQEIGESLADKHDATIRVYKGGITKLGTFKPLRNRPD